MDKQAINAVTEICSTLQYLLDRGELEHITNVEESVRYSNQKIESFVLKSGRKRYRVHLVPELVPPPVQPSQKNRCGIQIKRLILSKPRI